MSDVVEGVLETWTWYCRVCGATDEVYTKVEQEQAALNHVNEVCQCRSGRELGWAESGHLIHVWRYSIDLVF